MRQKKPKPNPENSSTLQALLDLQTAGFEVDGLIEAVKKDKKARTKADELFDSHRYPDTALVYTKTSNFNECRARYGLKPKSVAVLDLLVNTANQSGLVSIPQEFICEILKADKRTVGSGIKELVENGFICVYRKSIQHQSPIYMINPMVSKTGKPATSLDMKRFLELVQDNASSDLTANPIFRYRQMDERFESFTMGHGQYENDEGEIVRYNTIVKSHEKEKEPSVAADSSVIDDGDNLPF